MCACGCLPVVHEHHHDRTYCGRCADCPRYRPVRLSWWQLWRPRLRVPDSPAGLFPADRQETR